MKKMQLIYQQFESNARALSDKDALIFEQLRFSFSQIQNLVHNLDEVLNPFLSQKNSALVVLSDNGILTPCLAIVASKNKSTVIPAATGLRKRQLIRLFEVAQPNVMVVTEKIFLATSMKSFLDELWFDVIVVRSSVDIKVVALFRSQKENPHIATRQNSAFVMNFTSGSTGAPKAVCVSEKAKLNRMISGTVKLFNLRRNDVILVSTPQYHSLGFRQSLLPLIHGSTGVIMRNFGVSAWLKAVADYRITFSIGIPNQLSQIVAVASDVDRKTLSCLRALVSSSSPFSKSQREACWAAFSCKVFECFGASEIGIASVLEITGEISDGNSVGYPVPRVDVKILNLDTKARTELKRGEVGEIAVKSPFAFEGYYSNSKSNISCFEGYFRTGDLGYLSKKNELFFKGRLAEVMKVSGINVFPKDIEFCCMELEGVDFACAVASRTSAGDSIIALAVVANQAVSEDEILRHLMRELASWQIPKKVIKLTQLPQGATGKVDRKAVCELFSQLEKRENHV